MSLAIEKMTTALRAITEAGEYLIDAREYIDEQLLADADYIQMKIEHLYSDLENQIMADWEIELERGKLE
jgi:hypothetical protein